MTLTIHSNTTAVTFLTAGDHLIRGDNVVTDTDPFISRVSGVRVKVDGNVIAADDELYAGLQGEFEKIAISTSGYVYGAYAGILIGNGTEARIVNSGTIASATSGSFLDNATLVLSADLHLINHGTIENMHRSFGLGTADAIRLHAYTTDPAANITNAGRILGNIQLDDQNDAVANFGIIEGDIFLGGGNDVFSQENGQIIDGRVEGGEGNDTYYIDDADIDLRESFDEGWDAVHSSVSYKLKSHFENLYLTGNDDIKGTGNSHDNLMRGNAGDNILRGKAGEDYFEVSEGTDVIRGGSGTDTISFYDLSLTGPVKVKMSKGVWVDTRPDEENTIIFSGIENLVGSNNDDILIGDKGDNLLVGHWGRDVLKGGDGDDRLYGGVDKDTLIGGRGADQFVFTSLFDSSANPDFADVIKDFQSGTDLIDISAFIPTSFIGRAAFSGTTGEVRYSKAQGILELDDTGDGTADFTLNLGAGTKLVETDLLL